jgi:S-adenosyl methyltransferase
MMSVSDDDREAQIPALFGKPTPARMYDYYLGGKDNFEVDRAAADQLINRLGVEKTRSVAWENRRFLWRVVEYLSAECGISQGAPAVLNWVARAHTGHPPTATRRHERA